MDITYQALYASVSGNPTIGKFSEIDRKFKKFVLPTHSTCATQISIIGEFPLFKTIATMMFKIRSLPKCTYTLITEKSIGTVFLNSFLTAS